MQPTAEPMTAAEVERRRALHQDYVGDVVLENARNRENENQFAASFMERLTSHPAHKFPLGTYPRRIEKDIQHQYDFNNPNNPLKLSVLYCGPTTRVVRRTFADAGFL